MCIIWKKMINKKDLTEDGQTDSEKSMYIFVRYVL